MMNRLWKLRAATAAVFVLGAIASAITSAEPAGGLPRATSAEAEGVSSQGLVDFLGMFDGTPHELHSVMLVRHGKVVLEAWWSPYAPELTHSMYSLSKSWTATAIGLAAGEKKLSVNDKVVSFFPELAPNPMPEHLADLTVKNLLSMAVGQDPDPTIAIAGSGDEWVKTFFATPIVKEPGSRFLYNSAATYMLSAIVTKVTGEKVIDYLKPRLFEPLGISGIDWETSPEGNNTGGWGLRLHTEDIAKFGQLFLQDGMWNGKRILPKGWVAEASTAKIQQEPEKPEAERAKSDWHQGYSYQMWRCRHDAYRGDGAFGQYIVVMPKMDAVLAITSQTPNMQGVLDIVWDKLLPAMHDGALPVNAAAAAALKKQLAGLALPIPAGKPDVALETNFAGKKFSLAENERGITSIGFAFKAGQCTVRLGDGEGQHELPLRAGAWAFSETERKGPYLVARAKNSLNGLPPFKVACAYRWLDDGALELTIRYIQSPHTETLTCHANGDEITVDVTTGVRPPFSVKGARAQ